jgi:putative phage-type endonuclease
MPDPEKKTISATEASALVGVNPYVTKWMLYQKFKNGMSLDKGGDSRMDWGKKLQPLILEQVAQDKHLEVVPNVETYHRRKRLGCTRDATILSPDRGPGALEIKCVFDYRVWMTTWNGGENVPRHYEIQLQTQMLVGDGEADDGAKVRGGPPYAWGIIAVWVCSDMYYFERRPIHDLWALLVHESGQFFSDIDDGRCPDPFGAAIETPLLNKVYAPKPDSVLDLSKEHAHIETATAVRDYKKFDEDWRFNQLAAERLKARLLGLAKDYERVLLPCGINYKVRKSGKGRIIVPYIPDVLAPPPPPPELTKGTII